ncbi:MAG: hypothetical protein SFX73_15205 [Kofleriaceae bacterium]|nr:hypothetical protein [Kofleriaceae bacterium]
MDLDLATRRTICQLVAGLITADAKLDTKEAAFVYRVARGFGLDVSARDPIVPLVDSEAAAARLLALSPPAQDHALRLLVDAACVDGAIQPDERGYLNAIGAALRISEEDLERRIVARMMSPR